MISSLNKFRAQELCEKSRRPPWAPVTKKPRVSVDVKQHSTNAGQIRLKGKLGVMRGTRHQPPFIRDRADAACYTYLTTPGSFLRPFTEHLTFLLPFSGRQLSVQRLGRVLRHWHYCWMHDCLNQRVLVFKMCCLCTPL